MKVLVLNGPNLNMLGKREQSIYGKNTLEDINKKIAQKAEALGLEVDFFQSNCEGAIIDRIQMCDMDAIIVNAGAYSHYSYAIADALRDSKTVKVEVHLSNIYARDAFRAKSVLSEVCDGVISGLGESGYFAAIDFIASKKV